MACIQIDNNRRKLLQGISIFAITAIGLVHLSTAYANDPKRSVPAAQTSIVPAPEVQQYVNLDSVYQKQLDEINGNANARMSDIENETTTRINDLKSTINLLIALILACVAIVSWMGYNTIRKWIKFAIQERVKELVTDDSVGAVVRGLSGPVFEKLLSNLESEAKMRLDEIEKQHRHLENIGNEMQEKLASLQGSLEQDIERISSLKEVSQDKVDIKQIEDKNPETRSSDEWYHLARYYFVDKSNLNLAYDSVKKAIALKSTKEGYVLLGTILNSMGSVEDATVAFKKAIELSPEYARAYVLLARVLVRINKEEAIVTVRKAASLAGNSHADLLICAFVFESLGLMDEAAHAYREAVSLPDADESSMGHFANFLVENKQYDEADEYFRKAIELSPTSSYVLNRYALFLRNIRGDSVKAQEYFKRAVAGEPSTEYPCTAYANFLAETKNYDEAEKLYEEALRRAPNDPYALASFARFLLSVRNDKDRAVVIYKQAKAADTDNSYEFASVKEFIQIYTTSKN